MLLRRYRRRRRQRRRRRRNRGPRRRVRSRSSNCPCTPSAVFARPVISPLFFFAVVASLVLGVCAFAEGLLEVFFGEGSRLSFFFSFNGIKSIRSSLATSLLLSHSPS